MARVWCVCGHRRADGITARYRRRDEFYRRAKDAGYRSRAAYKLEDLLRRLPPLKRGAAVVDLGCWPGAWLQVLAARVGPRGRIVGVDLVETEALGPPVEVLQLDFRDADAAEQIADALGRPADLLVSDAAPKLTGVRDVDRALMEELFQAALHVAERVLRPQGSLIIKGFPGPPADAFRSQLRERFQRVREVRPEGKRATSTEFYWTTGPGRG